MKAETKQISFFGLKLTDLIYLLCFTVLSILLHGYSYGTGDQALYIPLLNKLRDYTLFPTDYLFPLFYSHNTLVYLGITLAGRFLGGNFFVPYTILYCVTSFFWYIGIYKLASTLFQNRKTALLSCLLFILPYPVGGAAITTVEASFLLRYVTNTILIYLLITFFEEKYFVLIYLFAILTIVHPLSGAIFFPLIFLMVLRVPKNIRNQIYIHFTFLMLIVGFIVVAVNPGNLIGTLPLMPTEEWLQVLQFRNKYAFPLLWSLNEWKYLFIALLPLVLYTIRSTLRNEISDQKTRFILLLLTVTSFMLVVQILFTSIFPVSYIIILQLGRIWLIPIILSFIIGTHLVTKIYDRCIPRPLYLKIIILATIILAIFIRNKPVLALQPPKWRETQMWVKLHTNKNCTVLTNFYSQGFRVYSERSIVGEYKDGTISFYSPVFAQIWSQKKEALSKENWFTRENLENVQSTYPFSLVVLLNEQKTTLNRVFINDQYSVYQMPQLEQECSLIL